MDREDMEAIRDKVIAALRAAEPTGITDIEAIEFEDGQALPIMFACEGETFILTVDVA